MEECLIWPCLQLKRKMETMREARSIAAKLASVKTLGAHSKEEETDSASSWVEQLRVKDQQRKLAEQRVCESTCYGDYQPSPFI